MIVCICQCCSLNLSYSLPCYVHKSILYICVSISIQMAKLLKHVIPTITWPIYRPSLAPVPPRPSPMLLPSVCSVHIFSPMQAVPDASWSLNNHSPLTQTHSHPNNHNGFHPAFTKTLPTSVLFWLQHLHPDPDNQHLLPLNVAVASMLAFSAQSIPSRQNNTVKYQPCHTSA